MLGRWWDILAGNLSETLVLQPSYNPSLISQEYTNKLNQEKEINNTNLLSEEKYIKPDLDPARVRESENKKTPRFEEATLNATPHIDTQKELPENLSVATEDIPTSELRAIAKAKYGDKLPKIGDGMTRKAVTVDEGDCTKLYILHLLEKGEAQLVESVAKREHNTYKTTKALLADYPDMVVAVFTFVGRDLAKFDLCAS